MFKTDIMELLNPFHTKQNRKELNGILLLKKMQKLNNESIDSIELEELKLK